MTAVSLWPVTIPTALAAFLDFLKALPAGVQAFLHTEALLEPAAGILPFFELGMGWVIPACIGLGSRTGTVRHASQGSALNILKAPPSLCPLTAQNGGALQFSPEANSPGTPEFPKEYAKSEGRPRFRGKRHLPGLFAEAPHSIGIIKPAQEEYCRGNHHH